MSDITLTFLIIVGAIILFMSNRLPVIVVALGVAMALFFTGVLSVQESLAGFGDATVIFVATLFIVSGALEKTGVTAWAGQYLIDKAGTDNRPRLLILMMLLCAALTALISVNGAVAALLPVVIVLAIRTNRAPSQLLMPLVFSAHAGSMLALSGTPVSVITADAIRSADGHIIGYFEFAYLGIPLLLGSMAIIILFGEKLLPTTAGKNLPSDFSAHAHTLVEHYRLDDGLFRLRVRGDSPLVGQPMSSLALPVEGLSLVSFDREGQLLAARDQHFRAGDTILLRGTAESAAALASAQSLAFREELDSSDIGQALVSRRSGLAELMIPPRSDLIGEKIWAGMTTKSGDMLVLAAQRSGLDLKPGETLKAGDTLLLQGTWAALDEGIATAEVLTVNPPELVRRQAVPMGEGAERAIAVLLLMVALLISGVVPPAIAGLVVACIILGTGLLSVEEAYRAINWTTVILVGAMIPLSTAMFQTGAADLIATSLIGWVGDAGPRVLLAALFIITALLGQVISNTATALIIIPIGVIAAQTLGISAASVLMSVNIAAAASFLTPVATPTNLMVMEPGGYKFSDYWKLGLPLMIWFFIVAVFISPLIWRF